MAVDAFLKLEGIDGESLDSVHTKEIDILSWGWGMDNASSVHVGGGAGVGKVNVHDISVTKWVDKSSTKLMRACCLGEEIASGVISLRKAGGKEPLDYIVIELTSVFVTSVQPGGSGGEERVVEDITLSFKEFMYKYQPQKEDGSKDGGTIDFGFKVAEHVEA